MMVIAESADDGSKEGMAWAKSSMASKVITGSLALASALLARDYAAFDQHPELFNVANGTCNLETGVFQKHNPDDLLTKQSPIKYDPDAKCPKFEKFISEVMAGKEPMRLFLQRASGYSISAYTSETAMLMPYGPRGAGKSQFQLIMRGVMGSYAATADSEMLMVKHGDSGQPFEMAGMDGIRALFASEVEEGKKLAQAKVKRMTGGDPINACYKGKQAYEFIPQWKLWLAANDMPTASAEDEALWDRLKPIPFNITFRNQPGQIMDIAKVLLAEESSGILNWFITGFNMWRQEGLNYPAEVQAAADKWRESEDYIGRYLAEHTVATEDQNQFVKKADLFAHFAEWAKENKEGRGVSDKKFTEKLEQKKYTHKQVRQLVDKVRQESKNNRCWIGLRLADPLETIGSRMEKTATLEDVEDPIFVRKPTIN
jgi:putative DNA primase/helicase